ncbi:unnamed protein product [Didymodactylos carnosus]|uniref:IPT/TIG domain-containing protein n=1 Tax=Didymodactylos carnosus TaxID=1234261 RepID=A0A815Z5D2_9BILA|nr:unnamed protein product [Didymodactylos carnosus]CAF1578208.1 unnamed protein product [Didymodactylos carnosus]CAF4272575.1 unnamed protein product [Didymodactylos carnosus]CAF4444638.1 unnamed protein product [Didymodactylos carnosus]
MTQIYHTVPQVEVLMGGTRSSCTETCDFQWLPSLTPTLSSVSQALMTLSIDGTGFSPIASSNTVLVGSGSCTVTAATTTRLTCTIPGAPTGTYPVSVIVAGSGQALSSDTFTATIALQVTSISPIRGGAGGGYTLTISGTDFSSLSAALVDNNICTNPEVMNYTTITCLVLSTAASSNSVVDVVVPDSGNQITITGTTFRVLVGTTSAAVTSASSTNIIFTAPTLAPGIYPLTVNTTNGFARPQFQIEYRFYDQEVTPNVGSLYRGSDVYVQDQGFGSNTVVTFGAAPCTVLEVNFTRIHCKTTSAAPAVLLCRILSQLHHRMHQQ